MGMFEKKCGLMGKTIITALPIKFDTLLFGQAHTTKK